MYRRSRDRVCKWAESRRSLVGGSIHSVFDETEDEEIRHDRSRDVGTPEHKPSNHKQLLSFFLSLLVSPCQTDTAPRLRATLSRISLFLSLSIPFTS